MVNSKVILSVLFFVFGVLTFLPAQRARSLPNFQLFITPSLGYRGGNMGEYVFTQDGTGTPTSKAPEGYKQLSLIDWKVNSIPVAGLSAKIRYKRLFLQADVDIGLPYKCGVMEDYDWISSAGYQTHFSHHNNSVTDFYELSTSLGWLFTFLDNSLEVAPFVGFAWNNLAFLARDGYIQYASSVNGTIEPWKPEIPKEPAPAGKLVTYQQELYALDIGSNITFHGTDTLSFSLDFAVQPIFVLYAFDTHFAREQDFLDIVTFTAKIKTALTLLYNFTDSYSLALSLEGSFLPLSYGSSFTKLSSEPEFIPSGAKGGASHWFLGFNIGFRFNLFR